MCACIKGRDLVLALALVLFALIVPHASATRLLDDLIKPLDDLTDEDFVHCDALRFVKSGVEFMERMGIASLPEHCEQRYGYSFITNQKAHHFRLCTPPGGSGSGVTGEDGGKGAEATSGQWAQMLGSAEVAPATNGTAAINATATARRRRRSLLTVAAASRQQSQAGRGAHPGGGWRRRRRRSLLQDAGGGAADAAAGADTADADAAADDGGGAGSGAAVRQHPGLQQHPSLESDNVTVAPADPASPASSVGCYLNPRMPRSFGQVFCVVRNVLLDTCALYDGQNGGFNVRFPSPKFDLVFGEFGDLPYYPDQLSAAFRTGILVGVHGAALTFVAATSPGESAVVELVQSGLRGMHYKKLLNLFPSLTANLGSHYQAVDYPDREVNITATTDALVRAMDEVSQRVTAGRLRAANARADAPAFNDQFNFDVMFPQACPTSVRGKLRRYVTKQPVQMELSAPNGTSSGSSGSSSGSGSNGTSNSGAGATATAA
ncbi:hypothetical protein TSOC_011509 [Tetrabaena socialis]|uniref:Uncharacterized protein n=1 Tax=Tetrabaena socialis TaxID=47790 RepID=A0A2J7ZQG4_9CHLO|nr:hypothetical protein TSOC_011509 [Tetrabaena socialis]|eukprot:PNH02509.1 hypothetical protein TSOC_011509 [Tetrabaena socialis]